MKNRILSLLAVLALLLTMLPAGLLPAAADEPDRIVIDRYDALSGDTNFDVSNGWADTTDYMEGTGALAATGPATYVCINRTDKYNITLPQDWQDWYIEAWVYVNDTTLYAGGNLEISEEVDVNEWSWGFGALGLQNGWNKLVLPLTGLNANMTTIKNVRFFTTGPDDALVIKIDHLVLSRTVTVTDRTALTAAQEKAVAVLATTPNAALQAAYDVSLLAQTQADVDAFAARLTAALMQADAVGEDLTPTSYRVLEDLGCLFEYKDKAVPENGELFSKGKSFAAVDLTAYGYPTTGALAAGNLGLQFDLYVDGDDDLVAAILAKTYSGNIEMTSSGTRDDEEINVTSLKLAWSDGAWNRAVVDIATFASGSSTAFDPTAWDYLRVYMLNLQDYVGKTVDVRICNVRLVDLTAPLTATADRVGCPKYTTLSDKVLTHGRTFVADSALKLFWTNSGFSLRFHGTGVTADLATSSVAAGDFAYLNVYIDGEFVPHKTLKLDKTTGTYVLAEGLTAGEHTMEVRKRNEANYSGSATVGVSELAVVGGWLLSAPAAPTRQIDFIGDSITSGFGNLVTDGSGDYTSDTVDGTMTYAVLAAKQLGANANVTSRSGIAFVRGTDKASFYEYYTQTAALPGDAQCSTAWDFTADPADVVVINLGTNDSGAKLTGETTAVTDAYMTSEAVEFLELVREKNPNAIIIWTYGLMGNGRESALRAAVTQRNAAGDSKVYYLPLTPFNATTEGTGTHGHPTVQADINRSTVLANFIAEKTGWSVDNRAMLQAQLQWSAQYTDADYLANYTTASAKVFTDTVAAGNALLATDTATNEDFVTAANAVWQAQVNLMPLSAVSANYTVIDNYDSRTGTSFYGNGALDTTDHKEGAGALSTTGSSGTIAINRENAYNIPLPSGWQNWYIEAWLYVSDVTRITGGSCLEISEVVDRNEWSWNLNALGLQNGWNKVQLPLTGKNQNMTTIKNVRLFVVNLTGELTVKIDHLVLSQGKVAANTAARDAAITKAQTLLAAQENATLRAAVVTAQQAQSQADVDATTARLNVLVQSLCPHTETTLQGKQDASCISTGYTGDMVCTLCNKTTVSGTDIPAHVTENRPQESGDCGNDGKTAGVWCTECRKYVSGGVTIPASGNHDWDDGVITTPPSAGNPGVITYTCTVCGEEDPRDYTGDITLSLVEDAAQFTTYGRTSTNSTSLNLFWTNSGFAFRFNGTTASVKMTATTAAAEDRGYVCVYVDGEFVPSKTICLTQTAATVYVLAEDLPAGEHTIEVRKRNEAAYSSSATIRVQSVTADGAFLTPPAAPTRQIEFIGDSITSGFGNLVSDGSGDYTSDTVDGTMTYAVLAAKQLGANARVLSRSGIAYCRDLDKTEHATFQDYYTKTAVLPSTIISNTAWDFSQNPSDVVVINLGSNDSGATIDGAHVTDAYMTSEAVAFLELVREKNPNAVIIWTYGLMGNGRESALRAAVAQRNAAGDNKVYYLPLTPLNAAREKVGTHGHPTVQANINRSTALAEFIAEKTGWELDAHVRLAAQLQETDRQMTDLATTEYSEDSLTALSTARANAVALLANTAADNAALTAAADALWQSYLGLCKKTDVSKEYIVIDDCDAVNGATIGSRGGFDETDYKAGTRCLWASGSSGRVYINHSNRYNVSMPTDWRDWYLECWLYVSDPALLTGGNLEVSQEVDVIEFSWALNQLGLVAGWNKVQLPLGQASGTAVDQMTTIRSIRLFTNEMSANFTMKLDHVVLSRGKVAADRTALTAAVQEATALLATASDPAALQAALALADTAKTQADVDAFTARLQEAIAAANTPGEDPNPDPDPVLLGDVDDDGKITSTDARLTLQYYVKKIPVEAINTAAADVDGDGNITSTDARLILQYYVKKITAWPQP